MHHAIVFIYLGRCWSTWGLVCYSVAIGFYSVMSILFILVSIFHLNSTVQRKYILHILWYVLSTIKTILTAFLSINFQAKKIFLLSHCQTLFLSTLLSNLLSITKVLFESLLDLFVCVFKLLSPLCNTFVIYDIVYSN